MNHKHAFKDVLLDYIRQAVAVYEISEQDIQKIFIRLLENADFEQEFYELVQEKAFDLMDALDIETFPFSAEEQQKLDTFLNDGELIPAPDADKFHEKTYQLMWVHGALTTEYIHKNPHIFIYSVVRPDQKRFIVGGVHPAAEGYFFSTKPNLCLPEEQIRVD